jgi:hypothetical protein
MRLQRVLNTADAAVPRSGHALGVLRNDQGTLFFTTFEDQPIPAGAYVCKLLDHPVHGLAWEVCDVPGRTGILFHVGNDADDSDGCILVGFGFSDAAITFSADAYKRFRRYLAACKTFTLTVMDPK